MAKWLEIGAKKTKKKGQKSPNRKDRNWTKSDPEKQPKLDKIGAENRKLKRGKMEKKWP